jgi:hypothetical protein
MMSPLVIQFLGVVGSAGIILIPRQLPSTGWKLCGLSDSESRGKLISLLWSFELAGLLLATRHG